MRCKEKARESVRKYREKNKERLNTQSLEYYYKHKERCLENSRRWKEENKDRIKEQRKKYYHDNKERENSQGRIYREENKDKVRELKAVWARKNRARIAKWEREYLKTNISARLAKYLRTRIKDALKGKRKYGDLYELIGTDLEGLKAHLESQFRDGMSWDNYGEWHIDHILPCVSFDLSNIEAQKECFHYTNLQPLWRIENLKKGAKLDYVIQSNTK